MNLLKNSFFILAFAALFAACGETVATDKDVAMNVPEANASDSNTSGILEPVKWSFDSKSLGNDQFELTMTANLDKGWSIYSQHTSDDGPVPTAFEFESKNFEAMGAVEEIGKKKEGMDPLFEVNVIKFLTGPVVFKQKVKVTDYSKPVSGYLTYMTCDDKRCLPPTDVDFSFDLKQ